MCFYKSSTSASRSPGCRYHPPTKKQHNRKQSKMLKCENREGWLPGRIVDRPQVMEFLTPRGH